jgi:hypothetical protein
LPNHPNHRLPYVQDYLRQFGARKCEANAIVTTPNAARQLVRDAIEGVLGTDALERFATKRAELQDNYTALLTKTKLAGPLRKIATGRFR